MMVARELDGNSCAESIEKQLLHDISEFSKPPHLVVIIVGSDPASKVYVSNKISTCNRLGIRSTMIERSSDVSEDELLTLIDMMNEDTDIHGILVQSPLPPHIDEVSLTERIIPGKDVDGFHPVNLGRIVQGRKEGLIPCTPAGILKMLEHYEIELRGKRVVVIGRSRIVGMPLALLLASKGCDATVLIAHSQTENLPDEVRSADLVVAAIGRANTIRADWIKPGAVVVDVGINRIEDKSHPRGWILAGDVHPDVKTVASWVSPVPGGVGPMTVAMLMANTVKAARDQPY